MAMFIECDSVERGCKVIINLESVLEIVPLREGGSVLFITDATVVGGKAPMKVKDSYAMFKQFALETVSPDDIAARIRNLPKVAVEEYPRTIPTPDIEVKRGPGRPKTVIGTTTEDLG